MEHFKLNQKNIAAVYSSQEISLSFEVLSSNGDIFADKLGTVELFRAKLHVKAGARPKFCKARTVPYAAKDAIDQELDRLESTGIIKSVPYSDWAAPFVAVPKKDGRMQICGDYKLTINPLLDIDQYSA